MNIDDAVWQHPSVISWNQLLLNSYQRWLGQALVPPHNSAMEQAQALFQAPFVVVSHGA
ncbi:MAG: MEKHLA domain-containing protein, partial [Cyanothece sp. SIO1E1]|nr:MEKHLA domain-containing protein [Cyanothece sp. SIO1E1]